MPPSYGSIGCLQDVVERFDIVSDVLAMGYDEPIGLQDGWYVVYNSSSIPVAFSPIGISL
jgi:hypothetical protein